MRLRRLSIVTLLAAACGSQLGDTRNPSIGDDAQAITFIEEYGFCLGRCYSELTVDAEGHARVTVRERRDGAVLSDRSFTLPRDETDRLFELARVVAGGGWEPRYGCPDCADQGSYELTLRAGADEQRTVLDPAEHPAMFDPLVGALRTVLHRERQ